MTDFITQAGLIIITAATTAAVNHMGTRKLVRRMRLCLLRNDLRAIWQVWHDKDSIPYDVMHEVLETYDIYHKMGGNGTGDKMIAELKALPMREG